MNRFARLTNGLNRRAIPAMLLLAITIVISPALPSFPQLANAQPTSQLPAFVGRVCIVPGDSAACPLTLPTMIGPPSGHLNVSITILGSAIFNAFDVSVRWDPRVMNSTTVDLNSTVLPSLNATVACINGAGSRCGSFDGPGIAHIVHFGTNTTAPASGHLFRIPFFATPGAALSVGFQTGCPTGSVPNTNACVLVGIGNTGPTPSITPVPEGIQSQLLGVQLPTPLASALPAGNITGTISGVASNSTDTYVLPYPVALPGDITSWKVQFRPYQGVGGVTIDAASVQIKVFRPINATTLIVIGAGLVRDPRPILTSRLPSYPNVTTEETVIPYYADPSIAIQPGDLIGISITSPSFGIYHYPAVNASGTRFANRNVPLGGTISLSNTTFTVPNGRGPALQVFIQVPPPTKDTAGDGITDFVKLSPEMLASGADPCRKTVAVQLDYMVRPLQAAIDTVIQSFDAAPVPANITSCPYLGFPLKPSGIKLIIDVKNPVPKQDVLNFNHSEPLSFDSVKAAFFDPNRVRYFHYGIWAHDLAAGSTVSGVGEIFGSNFMVTLGGWPNGGSREEQAGTLMHELGHNLGLDHGGGNAVNFKTNYLSVMNYAFQVVGITRQTSSGNVTRFDFSSQALQPLNESALDEATILSNSNDYTRWVCPGRRLVKIGLVSAPMDYNCDSTIDNSRVSVDINNDTSGETLTSYNDWANLRYKFTESNNFGPGCAAGCDIGCAAGCDIGCAAGCDIGTGRDLPLDLPQAQIIEAQWAAFFASPHHSTLTSVSCNPSNIPLNSPSTCTATETDSSTVLATPTGIVSFRSSQTGSFTPTPECTLSGTESSATCSVTYTPGSSNLGSQTISALYPGDVAHLASNGTTTVAGFVPIITIMTTTTLKTDITGQIVIGADGIVLNCNGHTISGVSTASTASPNSGILLNGRSGVTIENCYVTDFYIGFQLASSSGTTLTSDSATGNGFGFLLSSSNNNLLSGNTATGNKLDGFQLQSSNNNNLLGDTANGNSGSGFRLLSSSNNNMQKNTANNNSVYGFALTSSSNNNSVIGNSACGNVAFDAFQSGSTGNKFKNNTFCTISGI